MRKQILLAVVALMLTSLVAGDSAAQGQEKQSLYVGIFKATNLDFVKKGPRPEDMPLIRQHVEMLQKLGDQGISIIAGHTTNHDETAFGLAVVRAASQDAARKILEEDPLVRAGILTVTVFPFDGLIGKNPQTAVLGSSSTVDAEKTTGERRSQTMILRKSL